MKVYTKRLNQYSVIAPSGFVFTEDKNKIKEIFGDKESIDTRFNNKVLIYTTESSLDCITKEDWEKLLKPLLVEDEKFKEVKMGILTPDELANLPDSNKDPIKIAAKMAVTHYAETVGDGLPIKMLHWSDMEDLLSILSKEIEDLIEEARN